jgi:hypothetical protein
MLKATANSGDITLEASADGLAGAMATIQCVKGK